MLAIRKAVQYAYPKTRGPIVMLECIEINPEQSPRKSIIWLHGLGADAHDFIPMVSALNLPKNLGLRFTFPHAPMMPITINQGYVMRAWYDILALSLDAQIDEENIFRSVALIGNLVQKETSNGLSSQDILLGGFSQGAVIALMTGLLYPQKLGGIIALSGYLPIQAEMLFTKVSDANRTIPIFIAHGANDNVVPYFLGNAAYESLTAHGYNIEWRTYNMAHEVCGDELRDLSHWIQQATSIK